MPYLVPFACRTRAFKLIYCVAIDTVTRRQVRIRQGPSESKWHKQCPWHAAPGLSRGIASQHAHHSRDMHVRLCRVAYPVFLACRTRAPQLPSLWRALKLPTTRRLARARVRPTFRRRSSATKPMCARAPLPFAERTAEKMTMSFSRPCTAQTLSCPS